MIIQKELSRRILQFDPTLCLEETSLEKIQSVLDAKDIIVPAVVFKAIYAQWGFPILRKKPGLNKKYPYGLTADQAHNEIKNGVRYW